MHILPGRPTGKPDQMSPIHAAVPGIALRKSLGTPFACLQPSVIHSSRRLFVSALIRMVASFHFAENDSSQLVTFPRGRPEADLTLGV